MSASMFTPVAASRTAVLSATPSTDTRTDLTKAHKTPSPRRWTLGDTLILAFSLLSLVFAVAGIVIALR